MLPHNGLTSRGKSKHLFACVEGSVLDYGDTQLLRDGVLALGTRFSDQAYSSVKINSATRGAARAIPGQGPTLLRPGMPHLALSSIGETSDPKPLPGADSHRG